MLYKTFVEKYNYLTNEELIELNSFCQLLPGASSTQLITLIAYKRGGFILSILTFLIWIIPACLIMGLLSFYIIHIPNIDLNKSLLKYIQPMALGFLLYAAVNTFSNSVNNKITLFIMLLGLFLTYIFFRTPWIIPILFAIGSLISNISLHNFPKPEQTRSKKNVQPIFLISFIFIFLILGFLSENARKHHWEHRKLFNVGENFYRFGSIVFGGGDVLLPIIIDQYVARPTNEKTIIKNPGIIKIDKQYLLTGYGLVKAIPGPVFSYAAFTGGLALHNEGTNKQVLASFIAAIAIFLPSILLVLFFYPLWNELKKYVIFYRSILGINAVIVGVMFAAFFYLLNDFVTLQIHSQLIFYLIISATFLVLKFTKIPPTFIVFTIIFLGIIF